ncbi:MAG: hypothetical protein PHP03_02975 [Candidatus Pacebacteria bacterium]|nr:hypothetical protein [Candidatus Paceibacterota bacterium]
MIIYLYGPDSYNRHEKLKAIQEDYRTKHPKSILDAFDLEEENKFSLLKEFVKSRSLFEASKMAIIRNTGFLEDKEIKEIISLLKENMENKDTVLCLTEDKKLPKAFDFLLKEPVYKYEFDNLEGMEWQRFVWNEVKKRGLVIDRESQDLLMRAYAGNVWGLITELDKLSLLQEKNITKSILKKHFDDLPAVNVFDVLGDIKNTRNTGMKLAALEELFSRGQDPTMIFNLFSVFARTPQEKEKMADYDAAVKSGKMEYEEILLNECLGN